MKSSIRSLAQALPCLLMPTFTDGVSSLPSHASISSRQLEPQNPINDDGWYADPDGLKFGDTYWVYATISIAFDEQTYFDAFSSPDLATWTKHERVFSAANGSSWAHDWLWAPCTVERGGRYYFYYTANNPIANEETAGIGVAVADSPAGPFVDLIDRPLVDRHYHGANAMDQQVFFDDDEKTYLIWGGSFANIVPLGDDMASFGTWPDGSSDPVDITPDQGYGEGPFMLKRAGTYYFMWSENGYGDPDYQVAYAMSESITGPFERIGLVLSQDGVVADGPGHHSVFRDGEDYYIAYHRRIIGDDVADHRVLAVDRFYFNEDGTIRPVVMT